MVNSAIDSGQLIVFEIQSVASLYGAVAMTRKLSFMADLSQEDIVLIATVVSELGTNILKYAGTGKICVSRIFDEGHEAIQVVAEDQGCGIRDVNQAMADHFSTSGTLGMGLPAVHRIMTTMSIESSAEEGTRVVTSKWLNGEKSTVSNLPQPVNLSVESDWSREFYDIGDCIRPMQGELESGDISLIHVHSSGLLLGLIDVSGHGPQAHALACRMQQTALKVGCSRAAVILESLHQEFRGTLGAAVAIATLDRETHRLEFAGVGNINIWVMGRERWRGVCRDGIVGERMNSIFLQTVHIHPGDLILMASDGVSESRVQRNFSLFADKKSAHVLSESVIREAGKAHDDASCLILRCLR
jgi:anti-sigma regulatory factor (Ser/Thr protein kinase)